MEYLVDENEEYKQFFETTKDVIPKLICPCSFAQDNNSIISLCFSGLCLI